MSLRFLPFRLDRPTIIVGLGVILFGIIMTDWSLIKATVYDGYSADLGNMWQSVWNLGHGYGWVFTHPISGDQLPRLAIHADYLLLGYLPWVFWDTGWKIMLATQAIGVSLAAWALYWLGRRIHGHATIAAMLAIAYLSAGSVQFPTLWQYHSVLLVPTFLLAMTEGMVARRRPWMAWLWFGLALVSVEQVGLVAGPLMAWLWWHEGQRRRAWASLIIGWTWSWLHFGLIIPFFRPDMLGPHLLLESYYPLADAGSITAWSQILSPQWLTARLWQSRHLVSSVLLLLPFGGLALAHPLILLAAIAILPFWLADLPTAYTLMYQHHVLTLPILALATCFGIQFILQRLRPFRPWVSRWLAVWLMMCGFLATRSFSLFPWTRIDLTAWRLTDPDLPALAKQIQKLPSTATVAHNPGMEPQARSFRVSWQMPRGAAQADYLIFYQPRLRIVARNTRTKRLADQSRELQAFVQVTAAWKRVASYRRGAIYQRQRPLTDREREEMIQAMGG